MGKKKSKRNASRRGRRRRPLKKTQPKSRLPYEKIYLKRKKCYSVRLKKKKADGTRKVFAKCTTKENANKQLRLLAAWTYDPKFRQQLKTRQRLRAKSPTPSPGSRL